MINKFRIDGGQNDYATIIEPDNHENERQQLISEGYMPWSKYKIKAKESENYGKVEELWMK